MTSPFRPQKIGKDQGQGYTTTQNGVATGRSREHLACAMRQISDNSVKDLWRSSVWCQRHQPVIFFTQTGANTAGV
jgi:hypothetical protein